MKAYEQIELVQTCSACPEQYDAFFEGNKVGYVRLRHGHFTVQYPDERGEVVYEANPKGDGIFESNERPVYLETAQRAIYKAMMR